MPAKEIERLTSLNELRQYVNYILCQHEQLEIDAFPFTEKLLLRGDRPCGMFFSLRGPRSVVFSAIWETDRNTILFYNSTGERFRQTVLAQAPSLS
ncbi:MAG: hypothetical protein JSS27_17175 [Planctomycetes bacterium]|nr:hypothetical protein [Planctomycetota bacterium]